jgi:hypothetical protein
MTAGKCCLVDGKVVGTNEGLHHIEDIWKAMTSEMILGEFAQMCKEVSCYLQITEPYFHGLAPPSMRFGNSRRVLPGN